MICECKRTQAHTRVEIICKHTHRFVAQPDYVRHRTGSTILHDNPQVCVLEITAIVLHNIGATNKHQTQWWLREFSSKQKQQMSCHS